MKVWKAAIYVRLSKDDKKGQESNSITSQRKLINSFVRNYKDISIAGEFVDDGYSGMNFKRPGFIDMLDKIYEGSFDCVIVKDFSRFGRNYIESGKYIQQIFPEKNIRFISINDNYDSENNSGKDMMLIPFKMLINDYYAKDISNKVKSQIISRQSKGEYTGNFPPIGYRKLGRNLEIDQRGAAIVSRIIRLKLNGYSNGRIAEHLNAFGIPSPMDYKLCNKIKHYSPFGGEFITRWHPVTVQRILEDTTYKWCDNLNKRSIPIESVSVTFIEKLGNNTRTAPGRGKLYPYPMVLTCGKCREKLIRKKVTTKEKTYVYYVCKNAACTMRINELQVKKLLQKLIIQKLQVVNKRKIKERYIEALNLEITEIKYLIEVMEHIYNKNEEMRIKLENYNEYAIAITDYENKLTKGIDKLKEYLKKLVIHRDCVGEYRDEFMEEMIKTFTGELPLLLVLVMFYKVEVHLKKIKIIYNFEKGTAGN